MKKCKLLITFLLALGLALSLWACGSDKTGGSGNNNPDDNNEPTPPPAVEINVGDYAREWTDGTLTLDLKKQKLTGDNKYADFTVTAITGEKADAKISCTADEKAYTLSLNDDGKLEMKTAEATQAEHTFSVVPREYAGAWLSSDPWTSNYYSVSPVADSEGKFAWAAINRYNGEINSDGTAATEFSFDNDGTAKITFVDFRDGAYPYNAIKIYIDEDDNLSIVDEYDDTYTLTPYAAVMQENASYFDENNNRIAAGEENKLTFNGTEATYTAGSDSVGAWIKFTVDGTEYKIQQQVGKLFLIAGTRITAVARYDISLVIGEWSNSDNTNTLVIADDRKATFNGKDYPLGINSAAGEVYFDFNADGTEYTVHIIPDIQAAIELKANGVRADYYILDEAKKFFVGSYTDNATAFSINESYKLSTADMPASQDGTFTYIPDFQCIAYVYGPASGKIYLIHLENGVFGKFNSQLQFEESFFSADIIPDVQAMFLNGLESDSDTYTTGGTTPKSLAFDFAGNKITYEGKDYSFFYDYEISALGNYPVMLFMEFDEENNTPTYYHSVIPNGSGVIIESLDLTAEDAAAEYEYFISAEVYDELLGLAFIYHGTLFDETIRLDSDGKLYIDTADYTQSDNVVSSQEYTYGLRRTVSNGQETISLLFGIATFNMDIYVNIYNRTSASIAAVNYARADYSEFVGSYNFGTDVIALTNNGNITVNGEKADVTQFKPENGSLTVKYNYKEKSFTAVFSQNGLALSEGSAPSENYTSFDYDVMKFVGTFTLGKNKIVVSSKAPTLNEIPSLNVTFNGESIKNATLAVVQGGKQQLKFTAFIPGEPTPEGFPGFPISLNITITLDGNTLTISDGTDSATATANEWTYADFAFDGEKTVLTGHTFACLLKENGTVPVFLYDGKAVLGYSVTIDEKGVKTLVTAYGESIEITVSVAADGTVTVTAKDTSAPPPPPAPPAPPLDIPDAPPLP